MVLAAAALSLGLMTLTDPHVRSTIPDLRALLTEGQYRSETFRSRVARLEASDLIVYIEYDYSPPALVSGFVSFLGVGHPWRFVRVRVRWGLPKRQQLAILGHELQHAVEIAEATDVVDSPTLGAFYKRIGAERALAGCRTYDTDAAVDVQWRVFKELRAAAAPGRAAGDNLQLRRHAVAEPLPPSGIQ